MSIQISKRLEGMVQSDIRRMTRECLRVGGINLCKEMIQALFCLLRITSTQGALYLVACVTFLFG